MAILERPAARDATMNIQSQAGWATCPALAYDGSGALWAAWLERLDGADAIYLLQVGGGAPPRQLARAEAIKDGPALAWSAPDGLCCVWQFRAHTGPAGRDQEWRLAVVTHADQAKGDHTADHTGGDTSGHARTIAPAAASARGAPRPSHPVLASNGRHVVLGYELHHPSGAEVVVRLRDAGRSRPGGAWTEPLALSQLRRHDPVGAPEAAYDLSLAIAPDEVLWAAWIEARDAGYAVWTAHVPASQAADPRRWSAPESISGGPHLPATPCVLPTRHGTWVAWSNFSGGRQPAEKLPAWADGPERRWERLGHKQRRRVHVRRFDAAKRRWEPEWREPERDMGSSHYPVLVPVARPDRSAAGAAAAGTAGNATDDEVAVLCRRAVPRALGWSVEAYRMRTPGDGSIRWSAPVPLTTGLPPGMRRPGAVEDASDVTEGTNLPVAAARSPAGSTLAWQRHDRVRTAPGFHLTYGHSSLVVVPFDADLLPEADAASQPVTPAAAAPEAIRSSAAPPTVSVDGREYRLVFGNLHRHAESSTCGIDHNGQAEWHMRHAPHVNRSQFLAVTDHGEHLNDADWREQCLSADFYTWPGVRAAFPGIEWTSEAPWQPLARGHKNIIFSRSDLPFVDCWMPHSDEPERLWAWLREHDPSAVTIPHHTMRGKTPTFWEHVDEARQPVVEIFQDHRGSAEWLGAPAATDVTTRVQGLTIDPRGSTRRALDKGLKVGFVASGDHGGIALAGVYTTEVAREGILDALRARRCFATTGDRLLLDFRVNGVFQGGEVTLTDRPTGTGNERPPLTVTLHAEVLRPVRRIVLIRDGIEAQVLTPTPTTRAIDHTWESESPFIGTSYFYVRIESADGELAWSSPIWVTREWSPRPRSTLEKEP